MNVAKSPPAPKLIMTVELTKEEAEQIKQLKDFLAQYNKVSEMCFKNCAWDFTTRSVLKKEETCVMNCMEKYLKASERISQRFQEFQMISNENALSAAQKLSTVPR